MKKFKKIKMFDKKPSYGQLLAKYNSLVLELETLQEEIKSDLYITIFDKLFTETEKLKNLEEDNKRLKAKNKELKNKLLELNK